MQSSLRIIAAVVFSFGPVVSAHADDLPFIGTWDCGVATFMFGSDRYNNGSEDLQIEEVQEGSDGSYTLMFADDYMITLSGFTDTEMGWFSPATGDSLQCTRLFSE